MARWRPPGGSVGDDARRALDRAVVNGLVIRWMGVVMWLLLGLSLLMVTAPARFGANASFAPVMVTFLPLMGGYAAAAVLGFLYRRRRERRWTRDPEASFGDGCPHCGQPSRDDVPCCSRMPMGWSADDRIAYWHEVETAGTRLPDARRVVDPTSPATRLNTAGDRRRAAWGRPRGPSGSSPAAPAGGRSQRIQAAWILLGELNWRLVVLLIFGAPLGLLFGRGFAGLTGSDLPVKVVIVVLAIASAIPPILRFRARAIPSIPRCRGCGFKLHPPCPMICPECGNGLGAWNTVSFVPDWPGDGTRRPVEPPDEPPGEPGSDT